MAGRHRRRRLSACVFKQTGANASALAVIQAIEPAIGKAKFEAVGGKGARHADCDGNGSSAARVLGSRDARSGSVGLRGCRF